MLLALKKVREEERRRKREETRGQADGPSTHGRNEKEEVNKEGQSDSEAGFSAAEFQQCAPTPSLPLIERIEEVHVREDFSVTLRILQDPSGMSFPEAGHGCTVWDSAIVLSRYISQNREVRRKLSEGCRGLELGCGCALSGLTAFVLGCNMVLTDVASVLPITELNIKKNEGALQTAIALSLCSGKQINSIDIQRAPTPRAGVLDWTSTENDLSEEEQFDVILGADLMYDKKLALPLAKTIVRHAGPSCLILIAHEFRKQVVDDSFLQAFSSVGIHFEKLKDTGLWENDICIYQLSQLGQGKYNG